MSPQNNENTNNKPPPVKPEKSDTAARKSQPARQPHERPLNCARCDSPNTKFCYYNNYNLSQPRHFCKTCRRYWTKGGALRNVPIGGGSRRNKRKISSSSSGGGGGGLNLFHGLSPAMDFHRPNPQPPQTAFDPFSSIGDFSASDFSSPNPICGSAFFNSSSWMKQGDNVKTLGFHGMGILGCMNLNLHTHLTPSNESLSSLNRDDLHLKLQQQRLALVLGGNTNRNVHHQEEQEQFIQKSPTTIQFQNLDNNSRNGSGNNDSSSNINWGGIQPWSEVHHMI